MVGCLLLGAGFFIKLDATGPCGKFLICNEGVLAAFERVRSRVKFDRNLYKSEATNKFLFVDE